MPCHSYQTTPCLDLLEGVGGAGGRGGGGEDDEEEQEDDDEDNGCGAGGFACRVPLFPSDHLHLALYRLAVQSARHITVRKRSRTLSCDTP